MGKKTKNLEAARAALVAEKRGMNRALKAANRAQKAEARKYGDLAIARAVASGSDSMYLRTLLNPEQYQTSYPDEFGDKVAVCKFVNNRQLEWDSDGNYWCWVTPTLGGIVRTMSKQPSAVVTEYKSVTEWAGASVVNGKPVTPVNGLPIPAAKSLNIDRLDPPTCPDATGFTVLRLTSNSSIVELPTTWTGACVLFVKYEWAGQATDGTVSYVLDTGVTATIASNASATIPIGTKTIRFFATNALASGTAILDKFIFSLSFQTSGVQKALISCEPVNDWDVLSGDSESGIKPVFEEYRVVAQSVLITYEGDTLYNGGNITGRIVNGGTAPLDLGMVDYQSIASLPDSYERPLTMGAYAFWKPTDEKDMLFRPVTDVDEDGDLPSVVFAGTVKNVANAVLRLRVTTVVEAKTSRSFMSTDYSVVDPDQIKRAAIALRGIPRIMENPLHLEDIKKFLQSIVTKGKQVYDVAAKVAPVAIPLGKALGSLLI